MGLRAIAGVLSTQITQALGFTPVNKAGDTMTGALTAPNYSTATVGSATTVTYGTFATGTGIYSTSATNLNFAVNGASIAQMTSSLFIPFVNGSVSLGFGGNAWQKLYLDYTNTATVGSVTINKSSGRVNLAAGGTQLTLTNSNITAASKVFLQAINASGNAVSVEFYSVPAAGSATINAFPAVTNQTAIDFFVMNAD